MKVIPIDKELKKFEKDILDNPRIVFSAKYGEGKYCFLNEFAKSNAEIASSP